MRVLHGSDKYIGILCGMTTLVALLTGTPGCAPPVTANKIQATATPEARFGREAELIKADPVGYLRRLYEKCDALEQYRLTFYRQERIGAVVQTLTPMEKMDALFRKHPFSVKFTWESPDPSYYESVYVQGQNDNKLVVRERKGVFPFPPQVRAIDPELPVKLGIARNTITDFGLARATRRTLLPFEDPALKGVMTIAYAGVVDLDPTGRPAYCLRIERPPTPGYAYTRQDYYIDAETLLPAGTDLWLKSGELGARYRYADIDTNVQLTDSDFRLSQGHPDKSADESGSQPSAANGSTATDQ